MIDKLFGCSKMKKAKEAKEQKDLGESWQRALDDSIKFHAEQREFSEKINHGIEKAYLDCAIESGKENRKKEDRMIRIEAKLDELLARGNNGLS